MAYMDRKQKRNVTFQRDYINDEIRKLEKRLGRDLTSTEYRKNKRKFHKESCDILNNN